MNVNTIEKLGYREIDQLADLLKAYAEHGADFLTVGVKWEYNPNSDNLFLVDSDFNVAMLNDDGKLYQWHNCGYCGHEGSAEDFDHEPTSDDCKEEMQRVKNL